MAGGKSNTYENDWLKLVFHGTAIDYIAQNNTTAPLTQLFCALHIADPGEAGAQNTNETVYGGYARIAVNRNSGGWTITDNTVNPVAEIAFATCTSGTASITHWSVGTHSSGVGKILYYGPISPAIAVATGVTPRLSTASAITED
jgi:hypothetical protein